MNSSQNLETLLALAEGRLDASERAALVHAVLQDPLRAREVKLALRLAEPAQSLATSWVSLAQQPAKAPWFASFTKPAWGFGLAAALVLGVSSLTTPGIQHAAPQPGALAQNDRFSSGSFEGADDSFMTGGFEPHSGAR